MILIPRGLPPRRTGSTYGETPRQRIVRLALVACLFCAALWGLWENNRRRMPLSAPESIRMDATGALSQEQEATLARYTELFAREYAVPLVIRVRNEPFTPGEIDVLAGREDAVAAPRALFLGLCPARGQVVLMAPPLARRALGEDLLDELRVRHFIPYFAAGNWPEGLAAALNLMNARFADSIKSL